MKKSAITSFVILLTNQPTKQGKNTICWDYVTNHLLQRTYSKTEKSRSKKF